MGDSVSEGTIAAIEKKPGAIPFRALSVPRCVRGHSSVRQVTWCEAALHERSWLCSV